MKVRITQKTPQFSVDETFTGNTADDIVRAMKDTVAARVNFMLRPFVTAMTPLQFAQEVVRRYNDATHKSISAPQSCAEFLDQGEREGIVTFLDRA